MKPTSSSIFTLKSSLGRSVIALAIFACFSASAPIAATAEQAKKSSEPQANNRTEPQANGKTETPAKASAQKAVARAVASSVTIPNAQLLTGSEEQAEQAMSRFQKLPREKVIQVVRSWLESHTDRMQLTAALRVAVALEMSEVVPDLLKAAETSEEWRVFHTINRLHRPEHKAAISSLFLQRIEQPLSTLAKMAVLEGLQQTQAKLPQKTFTTLLESPSYEVREALLAQFFASRESLERADQIARFNAFFKVKPYQVRLEAMKHFASLPAKERKALSGAVTSALCQSEEQSDVQKACRGIASEKGPAK